MAAYKPNSMKHYIFQVYNQNYEAFGSRMFDYSGLYAIAKETQKIPSVSTTINKYQYSAFKYFNSGLPYALSINETFPVFKDTIQDIETSDLNFTEIRMNNGGIPADCHFSLKELSSMILPNKNYKIIGRFGFFNLWYHKYYEEIMRLWTFNRDLVEISEKTLPKTNKKIVAISMRYEYQVSEYAQTQVQLTQKYYKKAMLMFNPKDYLFVVFSDLPEKNQSFFNSLPSNWNLEFMPKMSSAHGMCTMSLCDHFICANSSFSIWAAFLGQNPNKMVICPKYYMKPTVCNFYNCNYYPDSWLPIAEI